MPKGDEGCFKDAVGNGVGRHGYKLGKKRKECQQKGEVFFGGKQKVRAGVCRVRVRAGRPRVQSERERRPPWCEGAGGKVTRVVRIKGIGMRRAPCVPWQPRASHRPAALATLPQRSRGPLWPGSASLRASGQPCMLRI